MKRPALQSKQVVLLRIAFRARKVLVTFEKRAPSLTGSRRVLSPTPRHKRWKKVFLVLIFTQLLFEWAACSCFVRSAALQQRVRTLGGRITCGITNLVRQTERWEHFREEIKQKVSCALSQVFFVCLNIRQGYNFSPWLGSIAVIWIAIVRMNLFVCVTTSWAEFIFAVNFWLDSERHLPCLSKLFRLLKIIFLPYTHTDPFCVAPLLQPPPI